MKNSLTWAAFFAALLALTGSLLLSWLPPHPAACPLCLYQRLFVMGSVGVLGVGLCVGGVRPGFLSLLTLPMAGAALAVALFHVYLVYNGTLECPPGLFGLGLAPQQSLVVLLLLMVLLLGDIHRSGKMGGFSWLAIWAPAVLGVFLAFAAIKSSPPPPAIPLGGWLKPLEEQGCRPVYRQPSGKSLF